MTAVLTDPQPTAYVPGWSIYTDLTPPELISARRLTRLRRSMAIGLAALLVAVLLVFAFATLRHRQATDDLAREQATTAGFAAAQSRYAVVTQIQGSTTSIRQQLAGLMAAEVDTSGLLASVRSTLPRGTVLDSVQVTVAGGATAAQAGGATTLDTSGATQIGRVTLSGTSPRLEDIATYVDTLGGRPGLVDVVPVTNQASGSTYTFTVTASVTDAVLTNRYAVAAPATPTPATPTPAATAGAVR